MSSDVFVTREHAIAAARSVGKRVGYAVALHGTGIRDVDLLCVPWVEDTAYTPRMLVEEIALAIHGQVNGGPTKKPHGRVAYVIWPPVLLGADHWYLDVSVMHRHRGAAPAMTAQQPPA